MTAVAVRGVTVGYGATAVLDHLDLDVPSGALAAVLGASGSGKTTLLRVLAGFLTPAAGSVRFGDRVVASAGPGRPPVFVPPERRRVGIVPQEGALFPHLDVRANVGFGLPRGSGSRIEEMLDLVGLRDFARARPQDLSGGQQQRVALARALAPGPDLVLLDEPFSSLDAALRGRLRAEVRDLLKAVGATAILVTHDQDEALSTADLLAVMRAGRIVQSGTPVQVYEAPADLDVARFVGEAVELPAVPGQGTAHCALGEIPVHPGPDLRPGSPAVLVLRPEQLVLRPEQLVLGPEQLVLRPEQPVLGPEQPVLGPEQLVLGPSAVTGVVREVAYHGHDSLLRVELPDGSRIAARLGGGAEPPAPGRTVSITVTGRGRIFPAVAAPRRATLAPPSRSGLTSEATGV
ncbi:MAG: transporter ATP-binding protein [Actinomycetota bacterium]|nr:transporter ATP-binding protein [Actinomycetota bacterium]